MLKMNSTSKITPGTMFLAQKSKVETSAATTPGKICFRPCNSGQNEDIGSRPSQIDVESKVSQNEIFSKVLGALEPEV